ncbi:hypothetical protein QNM99_27740, partial [Pseudomonas sp. PCH446]
DCPRGAPDQPALYGAATVDRGQRRPLEALREALARRRFTPGREQALATGLPSPSVDALEQLKRQVDSLPPILQPLFADIVSVGRQHLHQQAVTTVGASLNLQLGLSVRDCSPALSL